MNAGERIERAAARVEEVYDPLPKSELKDAALRLRLTYLGSQRERLREIQDAVFERLRPLPGAGELRMMRTEFPQSLYLQIMKVNPSRNPGREFPVDSVSWFEAVECCERLSWILGQTVRLPTADEFRVAVGDATETLETVDPSRISANKRGPMAAFQPNQAGFFDLLGNLAEWLQAESAALGGDPAPGW
ncbi:MAG: SUMF1/EgtB/PvdO family nonheme iron enzyme [Candidatus Synoicihabitans palmerolidicus]|nr:SUMF1/EgtB/PvdO family nonheme iron enzyme [Candidatus Synoicihabitans palmerolidicus]